MRVSADPPAQAGGYSSLEIFSSRHVVLDIIGNKTQECKKCVFAEDKGSLVIPVKRTSRRDRTPIAHRFIGGTPDHATHCVPEGRSLLGKTRGGRPSGTDTPDGMPPGMNSWASGVLSLRDEQTVSMSISRELPKNPENSIQPSPCSRVQGLFFDTSLKCLESVSRSVG